MKALSFRLRSYVPVIATGTLACAFLISGRVRRDDALAAIDGDLLMVLFALLVAVEAFRMSGWFDRAVATLLGHVANSRAFAFALLLFTGVLAGLLTNDVALFIVIPFTVAAGKASRFEIRNLVALEIVAANLLGCLTPLGNPQNLYLYHRSAWPIGRFIVTMLPFVATSAAALALAVLFLGPAKALQPPAQAQGDQNDAVAIAGLVVFALVVLEIARVVPAWAAAVAGALTAVFMIRRRFDVSILALFLFAFIIVAGLRTFPFRFTAGYGMAIAISQIISNVPATILLAPYTRDLRVLLYGANAGACGTIVASLANLVGARIYLVESGEQHFYARLTAISSAFLIWAGTAGWLLLRFT